VVISVSKIDIPLCFYIIKGVKTINTFTPLVIDLYFVSVTHIVVWFQLHISI
jgi:hypothetical protein